MAWRWIAPALSFASLAGIPASVVAWDSAPDLLLTVRPEPRRPKVGDEVILDLALMNAGTRAYESGSLGEDDCALGFDLTVIGPDGRELPDASGGRMGSCLGRNESLLPGGTAHARISINRRTGFLSQGEYRVSAVYHPSEIRGTAGIEYPSVTSHQAIVAVQPRTLAEMGGHIDALAAQLAALAPGDAEMRDRRSLVRRLAYTGDPRIIPAVIDAMYRAPGPGGGVGAREAFVTFLAHERALVRAALLRAAHARNLADAEMSVILRMLGTPGQEVDSLIERALAPQSPSTWLAGVGAVMASDDPDRFTTRLVAIARDRSSAAREDALWALVWNRSDEGVKALREALVDPDPGVRDATATFIRTAYSARREPSSDTPGRPLLPSDFDTVLQGEKD